MSQKLSYLCSLQVCRHQKIHGYYDFQMNVIVMSDYGVTDTRGLQKVVLDECIDLDSVQYVIYSSGYASIVPFALQHEKVWQEGSFMTIQSSADSILYHCRSFAAVKNSKVLTSSWPIVLKIPRSTMLKESPRSYTTVESGHKIF